MLKKLFSTLSQQVANDKFILIIPVATIIIRLVIFIFIPIIWEDSFITFRYAENLAVGNGLVYNLSERVYGTTTPLFAIILGGFYFIGIPCSISALIINLISESFVSLIVYKLLGNLIKNQLAGIISLLFVFSPANISWSIQGMETAFFGAIIVAAFYSLYLRKYQTALLIGFLSAMIRIDGLSVPFVIFLFIFFDLKFKSFKYLIIPIMTFILWLLFLYLYFGAPLPNSMMAKLILYSGHEKSVLPNLEYLLSRFVVRGYYTSALFTLFFLIGICTVVKKYKSLLPVIFWFFIYFTALIYSRTMLFGWYFVPPLFVYITVAGIGIYRIITKVREFFRLDFSVLKYLTLTGITFFSAVVIYERINDLSVGYDYLQNVSKKLGIYIKENSELDATVYLEPIGAIGYYSERYIFDDAALVSPLFLELNRFPYTAENRYKKIDLVKPDFVVLRNHELDDFYTNTELLNEYKLLKNFLFESKPDDYNFAELLLFQRITKILE